MSPEDPVPDWPEDGLEHLGKCPVCGDDQRELLYPGMTDRVFFCAPGQWSLWHCRGCGCAYLDPRPTESTIHLAYQRYYTHEADPGPAKPGIRRQLKWAIKNDYLHAYYGTRHRPRLPLGRFLPFLAGPVFSRTAGRWVRHLPRPMADSVCLDIGCGNGNFLDTARACGWQLEGLEPDPGAARAARQRGMIVHQSPLPRTGLPDETYDAVTMSHVIEHLHDPKSALQEIWRILKPGGSLWIATPNIHATGFHRFGEHWRGLEPPRHLVLFHASALVSMLTHAGFAKACWIPAEARPFESYARSHCIESGLDPSAPGALSIPWSLRLSATVAAVGSAVHPDRTEELICMAGRPE